MNTSKRPRIWKGDGRKGNGWRLTGWTAALALLTMPAIAMRFTSEVNWTATDFVFAAVLLALLGGGLELAARFAGARPRALGIAVATLAAFLTLWANAAVGLIGSEQASVNRGFTLLVFVGFSSAALFRLRPVPMRWILGLIAMGQPTLGIAARYIMPGHAVEWGVVAFFTLLWGMAAGCFHVAARRV